MRDLLPCPPCGRQGRPGEGDLAGFIERPRGSAPRERDHRGGDHPVPSRTRQLSPPSPRVLQRKAAGGQGVALAEGAFLYAPREARRGDVPLRASPCSGPGPRPGPAPSRRQAPRIAEGPLPHRLGSPRRAPALAGPFDGGRPCIMPLQARNGGALSRALPAFWGGRGVAGGVASSAGVLSRRGVPCWAGSARSMRRRFCAGPSQAFLRQRGSNNLMVVARPVLSRRSAVSKGLRPGCPPL